MLVNPSCSLGKCVLSMQVDDGGAEVVITKTTTTVPAGLLNDDG